MPDAELIQYYATVSKSGTPYPIRSWKYGYNADALSGEWSVEFEHALDVDIENDTFTLVRGFGGVEQTLFEDQPAQKLARRDGLSGHSRTVSGTIKLSDFDFKTAPSKTLYYYSPIWLDSAVPYGWKLYNGALYYTDSLNGELARITGQFFPNPNLQEGEFEVVTSCYTHYQVAVDLAKRAGVRLESTVPTMPIHRFVPVQPATSYFRAIMGMLELWNPVVTVEADDAGTTVIRVLDVHGPGSNSPQTSQAITLPRAVIANISTDQSDGAGDVVNHVHVKGAKLVNKTWKTTGSFGDGSELARKELVAGALDENRQMTAKIDMSKAKSKKKLGEYSEPIGFPDDNFTPVDVNVAKVVRYYHEDEDDPSRWILLREVAEVRSAEGLISQTETKHEYTPADEGYRLVLTTEEAKARHNVPGMPADYKEFGIVYRKIIDQSQIVVGCEQVEAVELVEEPVLFDFGTNADGTRYYYNPQTIMDAMSSGNIQTTEGARQEIKESTTQYRTVQIERETPHVLRQITTQYNRLTGAFRVFSQTVRNPQEDPGLQARVVNSQFERHFYAGAAPYQPAKVIEHPDINSDAVAKLLADRVFARRDDIPSELSVELSCLIPMPSHGATITISSATIKEFLGTAWASKTIDFGTFILISSEESGAVSGNNVRPTQRLKLRSVL